MVLGSTTVSELLLEQVINGKSFRYLLLLYYYAELVIEGRRHDNVEDLQVVDSTNMDPQKCDGGRYEGPQKGTPSLRTPLSVFWRYNLFARWWDARRSGRLSQS